MNIGIERDLQVFRRVLTRSPHHSGLCLFLTRTGLAWQDKGSPRVDNWTKDARYNFIGTYTSECPSRWIEEDVNHELAV